MFMDREEFLQKLRIYGKANDIPNITETNARFLRDLIKIQGTKNMLEIGTANGLSAICFWVELEKNKGKLTTIEFSENAHKNACENIKQVWLEDTVGLVFGNALDEIPKLKESFDFVFIDGMKRRTVDFLELVWDKVKGSWIIVIDDVIKFRDKMLGLYEYLEDNNIVFNIIPIDGDDGIMMIIK